MTKSYDREPTTDKTILSWYWGGATIAWIVKAVKAHDRVTAKEAQARVETVILRDLCEEGRG